MSHPDYMPWEDKYAANHAVIDKQHRKLVDYINKVMASLLYKEGEKSPLDLLKDCTYYAKVHFATEDKIMLESKLPDIEKHKKMHLDLISQLNNFCQNAAHGTPLEAETTGEFLRKWLFEHIDENDRDLADHISGYTKTSMSA